MSKIFIGVETVVDYPPRDIPRATVGISRYTIDELIELLEKYYDKSLSFRKLSDVDNIPNENNGKFWFDDEFISKYITKMSDYFEIWIPKREAPLLINHINQDLRVLISPMIGSE